MADVILDLFGQPVRQRREGRGRPEHVWSLQNSQKINLLFACGRDIKDVAAAVGLSVPTLRKHYFSECEGRRHAAIRMRALQLSRLNAEADKGNVAAEKALAGMIQSEQVRAVSDQVVARGRSVRPDPKPEPLGKKAAAKAAATNTTGVFGARTPPPSLLN